MDEREFKARLEEAFNMLTSKPPFPERENIPFIRVVRTHYRDIEVLLGEGFPSSRYGTV